MKTESGGSDKKENNKTSEGLTVDDPYIPNGHKNDLPFDNYIPPNSNPSFKYKSMRLNRTVVHTPPENNQNADDSDKIPTAAPLVFGVIGIILGVISFFTFRLLSIAGIVLSVVAIALGGRIKLTKGKIALIGAIAGLLGLLFSIVSLATLA